MKFKIFLYYFMICTKIKAPITEENIVSLMKIIDNAEEKKIVYIYGDLCELFQQTIHNKSYKESENNFERSNTEPDNDSEQSNTNSENSPDRNNLTPPEIIEIDWLALIPETFKKIDQNTFVAFYKKILSDFKLKRRFI